MASIVASRIEAVRRGRGLSQRALAETAGITRQAVGSIERGGMQPSVGIALRLARALGTTAEELFASPEDAAPRCARVAAATIDGRSVTHALDDEHLAIEPSASQVPNVFLGGCDLSVGLLSRHAILRSRNTRVLWLAMTNRAALDALARGTLHAAVVHGATAPQRTRSGELVRFEVATTEAGWLVGRGNPLRLRGPSDLMRKKVRLVNRPAGAGARRLLDEELRRADVDYRRLAGYDREVTGQLDAGRAIAQGFADAAIGMASVARAFGLDFVPVRHERCALVVPRAALPTPEIAVLLDTLRSVPYRRDLEALQSYDVTRTGQRIA